MNKLNKDDIILIVYLGVRGIDYGDIIEATDACSKNLSELCDDTVKFMVLPNTNSDETTIDCINPRLLPENEYELVKQQVNNFKRYLDENVH